MMRDRIDEQQERVLRAFENLTAEIKKADLPGLRDAIDDLREMIEEQVGQLQRSNAGGAVLGAIRDMFARRR